MSISFEYTSAQTTVTVETKSVTIHEVMEDFKMFLLAIGFHHKSVSAAFNEEEDT